ncbi:MAG: CinA family protein [Candidatus Omnitrophica bacterium]|nr:CinA family protein [Candidatus Omnitrophota bacterium]
MDQLKKLTTSLAKNKLTLALAESASGGYASYLLTKTPGASKVFKGSLVVYSLDTKNKLFKIPKSTLKKTQGVSNNIAVKLAKGVRKKLESDIGASLVGFAGPKSKKDTKTGTIFIAISYKNTLLSRKLILKGSRDQIRKKAANILIAELAKIFLKK